MTKKRMVSFVIPSFNESSNIEELMRRLYAVTAPLNYEFEFLFVDDGSRDETLSKLSELHVRDSRVKFISLSRNFGHQNALTAGLDHASGDCVISMDGDLQHPPEFVPELLHWWEEGYEIVYTYRKSDIDASFLKKITAAGFYKLINFTSDIKIDPNASDFRLMDKKVVKVLSLLREHEKFYRGLVKWVGFKQKRVDFDAASRYSGVRKYTLKKMLKLAMQGFLSYSYLPLYSVIFLCFVFLVLSIGYACFALYQKFITHIALPGHSSILLTVLAVAAVQLYALAIIALYVLKNFHESRRRPVYIVRETKGLTAKELAADDAQILDR